MTEKPLEDRVRHLEELVSYQEKLLEDLNAILIVQRDAHDELQRRFELEVGRLDARLERQANPLDPNEKPPHY
ncbi:MAG: SlyX family protein [Planctomycetales bacterium]|nr:SlyX family protein [Planctomycetales bacterium]